MPPDFIVIAGPNGAGKSTTSRKILVPIGIKSFDWDKEFDLKWKEFGYDPAVIDGIRNSVDADFQKHIQTAFSKNRPLAYETNFHSMFNFQLAKEAKESGYINSLYFLALINPEVGIKRVAERVRKGGHHVVESTIRDRFTLGLKMLDSEAIECFDYIYIYNSSEIFNLQIVIENKEVIHIGKDFEPTIFIGLPKIKSLIGQYRQ